MRWAARAAVALVVLLGARPALASDHADPIDPFDHERQEGGITDLFCFPLLENGDVAFPFDTAADGTPLSIDEKYMTEALKKRKPLAVEDQAKIKAIAVILDVRRALTDRTTLKLEPYRYAIHFDWTSPVAIWEPPAEPAPAAGAEAPPVPGVAPNMLGKRNLGALEARMRYGGLIAKPDAIEPNATIELQLKNDASLDSFTVTGALQNPAFTNASTIDPNKITVTTGVFDDPFIFPAFFGTNTVAMIMTIPISCFPAGIDHLLLWGTTSREGKQIDHVGRSLRTQNPRFDLLNTLPPREHVAAILEEHMHPSLVRDIELRFNLAQLAAYRSWDPVPDVMIYSLRHPVGFPNGRRLQDDVAALLAQLGDTLLLELSYHIGGWPRRTTNDKEFQKPFPWLAAPQPERPQNPPLRLTTANHGKLVGMLVGFLLFLVISHLIFAKWYHRRQLRKRYL